MMSHLPRAQTSVTAALVFGLSLLGAPAFLGCAAAAPLPVPQETTRILAGLDEERARRIIAAALEPLPNGKGGLLDATDVKFSGRSLAFTFWTGVMEQVAPEQTQKQMSDAVVKLDEVEHIRVRAVTPESEFASRGTVAGYYVSFYKSINARPVVNVEAGRLNELLAALLFFAPRARLTQGRGF